MKKTTTLWIILDLIFLVIFNALFFVMGGTEHNASVWMSYVFIHFAYIMLLLTPFLIRKGKSASVFGFSLFSISTVYFFIEFITGIIFILVAPERFNVALLVQLCLAGLYGIVLVANMIANERTAEAESKRQHEIAFVKDASMKLKGLLESVSDKETKKKIESVYDAVRSSPAKSHPTVTQIENRILQSIDVLEVEITAGSKENSVPMADALLDAVTERNARLKKLN